ncbi:hypothetical protein [Sphaerisporangium corydalis]|uniref:Secreted protein n=1 Tax=Sphaerisporangium corydalis TaxID=1441875 RepID=A0ABV9ES90_9ACTN|nr:hypothetical protein [Sphaerisporangium corydalis]
MEQRIPGWVLISVTAVAAATMVLTSTPALAVTASTPAFGDASPAALATAAAPTVTATAEDKPTCARIRGAAACVGPDGSDRPGISIEDTESDRFHATVEFYLNGYLGTKYVIHNLGGQGGIRGDREIGTTVTFRAAVYKGNHRIKFGRWKTVRSDTKYPVKRETHVTPSAARARSEVCTSTKGAATMCFADKDTVVFACDTGADGHQARAEYFVGGDPTARYEIHQLAGYNTCGKAEHGDLPVSKYRASLFDHNHRAATRLYKYH